MNESAVASAATGRRSANMRTNKAWPEAQRAGRSPQPERR